MNLVLFQVHDVLHRDSGGFEVVGDEGPVTSPPEGLRAHDGGPLAARRSQEPLDPGEKLGCLHVIGIPTE